MPRLRRTHAAWRWGRTSRGRPPWPRCCSRSQYAPGPGASSRLSEYDAHSLTAARQRSAREGCAPPPDTPPCRMARASSLVRVMRSCASEHDTRRGLVPCMQAHLAASHTHLPPRRRPPALSVLDQQMRRAPLGARGRRGGRGLASRRLPQRLTRRAVKVVRHATAARHALLPAVPAAPHPALISGLTP